MAHWVLLFAVALTIQGCFSEKRASGVAEHHLVVFAAASLRDAFSSLEASFRRAHPDVDLTLEFAGSQELRTQLEHGAQADVFASADQRQMDQLARARLVSNPAVFALNAPVIVVSKGSAPAIRSFEDLPSAVRIVIGSPEVPIGRYTLQILDRAGARFGKDFRTRVEANVVSRELNVRQVLNKVSLGEAQAGIVYRTDANAAEGRVTVVSIPSDINVIAEYPIALVAAAPHPQLARAWIDLVLSEEGQAVLRNAGFLGVRGGDRDP